MSRKLNPNAKEFIPHSHSDVIYIVRKGVVEEIRLEDSAVDHTLVQVNHFFGWTFTQIADFLRSSAYKDVLSILYEAMRQKTHISCFGVLLVYAFEKGMSVDSCEDYIWKAYNRFFKNEGEFKVILQREIDWAKRMC